MRQEEALKAMDLFEGAQEHNRVSKRSLKNWVVTILDTTPPLISMHLSGKKIIVVLTQDFQSLSSEHCR